MAGRGNDPESERQWLRETLKRPALRDPARDEGLVTSRLDGSPPFPSVGAWLLARRRWLIPLIEGSLVVTLAIIAVAHFAPGLFGSKAANTSRQLTPIVFTLPASAKVYCPSMPAWSPDGKYIALMARSFLPGGQGNCAYGDQVSGMAKQELNNNFSSNSLISGPMKALVLDAKTGGVVRQLPLVDLTGLLCKGTSYCDTNGITPVSLSWTPDGASVVLFSTLNVDLTGQDGQGYSQTRGVLEVMRADGTQITRALVGYGRATSSATGPGGGILPANIYSPPLFTWDLISGSTGYTDIHEAGGFETVDYAPDFQVGPEGQLTPVSGVSAGAITPWSYGVLWGPHDASGPGSNTVFRSSVWAWSADGRFVVPNVVTTVNLKQQKGAANSQPGYPGAYNPPFVSPPDAATEAVLGEITPSLDVIYIARDPQGARLASFACQPNVGVGVLTIRATVTGKVLLTIHYTFPTISTSYGCPGDAEAINWAPDGSRVAMTDVLDNQIVIWRIPEKA